MYVCDVYVKMDVCVCNTTGTTEYTTDYTETTTEIVTMDETFLTESFQGTGTATFLPFTSPFEVSILNIKEEKVVYCIEFNKTGFLRFLILVLFNFHFHHSIFCCRNKKVFHE